MLKPSRAERRSAATRRIMGEKAPATPGKPTDGLCSRVKAGRFYGSDTFSERKPCARRGADPGLDQRRCQNS